MGHEAVLHADNFGGSDPGTQDSLLPQPGEPESVENMRIQNKAFAEETLKHRVFILTPTLIRLPLRSSVENLVSVQQKLAAERKKGKKKCKCKLARTCCARARSGTSAIRLTVSAAGSRRIQAWTSGRTDVTIGIDSPAASFA